MQFNDHNDLAGKHAFLSASKYSWIRYDDAKLDEVFINSVLAAKGTELHEFASKAIHLGIKLPKTQKTLNMFINDVIGYRMNSEQVLYYSENAFGTADAISFKFDKKTERWKLMIFDLKTGITKASMDQLLIYTAMFCLEYNMKPAEIDVELRIYQNDEILMMEPLLEDIVPIMDKLISFDKRIKALKEADIS